jgi:hypothetical protein
MPRRVGNLSVEPASSPARDVLRGKVMTRITITPPNSNV